jgi:hypothetical protein
MARTLARLLPTRQLPKGSCGDALALLVSSSEQCLPLCRGSTACHTPDPRYRYLPLNDIIHRPDPQFELPDRLDFLLCDTLRAVAVLLLLIAHPLTRHGR